MAPRWPDRLTETVPREGISADLFQVGTDGPINEKRAIWSTKLAEQPPGAPADAPAVDRMWT